MMVSAINLEDFLVQSKHKRKIKPETFDIFESEIKLQMNERKKEQ